MNKSHEPRDEAVMRIQSMDELFSKFSKRALLMFLIGDNKGVQAWRLAGLVWDKFPADFPDFSADLVEGNTRAACWSLSEILKDRVGGHDLYWAALRIANEIPYDDPFEPLGHASLKGGAARRSSLME